MFYEGEIDDSGHACGIGTAVCEKDAEVDKTEFLDEIDIRHMIEGTWLDNKPHGICNFSHRL